MYYPLYERQEMVGRVGFEPTMDCRLSIMSRVPATNTASGPLNYCMLIYLLCQSSTE